MLIMEYSINTIKKNIRKDQQLNRTSSNPPQICYKIERKCRLQNFYIASIIIMLKLENDNEENKLETNLSDEHRYKTSPYILLK